MKYKVLLTHELFPEVHKKLQDLFELEVGIEGKEDLIKKVRDKHALLCFLKDPIDREVIDAAPELKIIANYAVGYDNIDVEYAKSKGIYVTNTPDLLTEATADLTWALILAVARRIVEADSFTRAGKFKGWEAKLFLGMELNGKRLGIIGLGRIGKAVARRASGFGMEIVYYKRKKLSPAEEKSLGVKFLSLEELLKSSDVISIHTPLTPDTENLINRERVYMIKRGAIFINTARGAVVDENALIERLENGSLFGAGFDVYKNEPEINPKLINLKNVVLLPHIGSATTQTRLAMANLAADNIISVLKGGKPITPV
ncbi:MAG: D-glycerate dehydrogenase [Candidatus Aminicenantes bacterium]|nr:D-glycerate dehydrogenase [Candidatus Aminicenantes bacterium]